ncbi:MAG: nitroreductase [Alphaproteobacteria bacterium]|jgi:nitroreductase|nr:nitroreductase [Alphaproteobacteria bacterium]MBT4018770.1 nitroreductase [Alphaproteobacteria bacterium]MBT4966359.1 nitroreductase [Alphaproteobacteria bacterium]MBT5160191.1 nitroreductase [Alphaproteobacteria bacterium]MBT6384352.1 nitroreductase [Alphaproteobacteria bacterium]
MNVSEAIKQRKSVRAFLDRPVETDLLIELLEKASRSPSGGNVQPWRISIVNGPAMTRFRALMQDRIQSGPMDDPQYLMYPEKIGDPYHARQLKVAIDMYGLLDIGRADKDKRVAWMNENFNFFGAPAAIFCHVERHMNKPQWSDLGMFLQTFMLLVQEAGLNTCAQEAWSLHHKTVDQFTKVSEDWMLFCGMAIGKSDPDHAVNRLETERASTDEWLTVI